jgi:hypothetical protein
VKIGTRLDFCASEIFIAVSTGIFDSLEDAGVVGRITLRCIFKKWNVGVWTGSGWLRIGTGGGHL